MKQAYLAAIIIPVLLSCSGKQEHTGIKNRQSSFLARNSIVRCISYERNCQNRPEELAARTVFDEAGYAAEYESYVGKEIFARTSQRHENGLLVEKTYHANKLHKQSTVKYTYDETGKRTKYVILDVEGNRISLHKIERKGGTENISDYDSKGKLTDYRTIVYDSLENPLVLASRKFRYTYNPEGLITESASVDTLNGSFVRRVYEYRELLPVKQTVYYGDSCGSVIRYEYLRASGEKW